MLKLNHGLGYDFNTVEFAVRDGIPIAIDFCNPAPDADVHSVGQANFEWVVEAAANMAIERAKRAQKGGDNLTWGTFVRNSAQGAGLVAEPVGEANVAELGEPTNEVKAAKASKSEKAEKPEKNDKPKKTKK